MEKSCHAACAGAVLTFWLQFADPAEAAGLFDTHEIKSTNLAPFYKWSHVLQSIDQDFSHFLQECNDGNCFQYEWYQMLVEASQYSSPLQKLYAVNVFFNQFDYVNDSQEWGSSDYWATPVEFMSKRAGDCEDYAIAKYVSLWLLGFREEHMRLVVLNDTLKDEMHAVLAVTMGNQNFILDNLSNMVTLDRDHPNYRPIYSINRTGWWRHS